MPRKNEKRTEIKRERLEKESVTIYFDKGLRELVEKRRLTSHRSFSGEINFIVSSVIRGE
jgi:hypothetical protein